MPKVFFQTPPQGAFISIVLCSSVVFFLFFLFDTRDFVPQSSSAMKKRHVKKPLKTRSKKMLAKSATAPAGSSETERPANYQPTVIHSMPPPEELFQQAEQEPNFRDLSAYVDSIRVLREKGFSYREIADWFSERGVDVTHNTVYRVFTKSLSDLDAHLEAERDEEESREEALRNQ